MGTKISVICPTYNSAAYIHRTLECLASQTTPPFEIVFCDDGSTDGTTAQIQNFAPKLQERGTHFKLLTGPHRGPGASRNRAVRECTGDWLAFLDADDKWRTNKIGEVLGVIEKSPEANFVTHWEEYELLDGRRSLLQHGGMDVDQPVSRQLYSRNVFSTSATVCRKELFTQAGGFDETLSSCQDYDLWLKMSPFMKVAVIQEPLGSYVEMPDSITAGPYWNRCGNLVRVLFRHRAKGSSSIFLFRSLRALLSRQWLVSLRNEIAGTRRH